MSTSVLVSASLVGSLLAAGMLTVPRPLSPTDTGLIRIDSRGATTLPPVLKSKLGVEIGRAHV